MTIIKHQKEGGRGFGVVLHLKPLWHPRTQWDGREGLAAAGQKNFSMHTLLLSLRSNLNETGDPSASLDKAEHPPLLSFLPCAASVEATMAIV